MQAITKLNDMIGKTIENSAQVNSWSDWCFYIKFTDDSFCVVRSTIVCGEADIELLPLEDLTENDLFEIGVISEQEKTRIQENKEKNRLENLERKELSEYRRLKRKFEGRTQCG